MSRVVARFSYNSGSKAAGEGGIRTREKLAPLRDFQSRPFVHSGTSPRRNGESIIGWAHRSGKLQRRPNRGNRVLIESALPTDVIAAKPFRKLRRNPKCCGGYRRSDRKAEWAPVLSGMTAYGSTRFEARLPWPFLPCRWRMRRAVAYNVRRNNLLEEMQRVWPMTALLRWPR